MYTVYILKGSLDGRFYTGYTNDLERRLKEHNKGKTKSIKTKGPFEIIYTEKFEQKDQVYKREQQIKRYKSGNAFKKLIENCGVG